MLTMCISMLPIITATFCMLCKKNTICSLHLGICAGIIVYFIRNGLNCQNATTVCGVILSTTYNNITVIISIFLLLVLVFFIKNSSMFVELNSLTEKCINSPQKVIVFLITLGILFSLDDYLLCIATAVLLTNIAERQGFSKEKTTFLINITAVCCCCLSPFSSWMPVIKHTLFISGIEEQFIYKVLPYNFSAIIGIVFVIMIGILKPTLFNSKPYTNKSKPTNPRSLAKSNKHQMLAFCSLFIVLIGSLILTTFVYKSSNAVIISTSISLIVTVPLFMKTKAINKQGIISCTKDAIMSTWDLSKLLFSIWLLTNVCKVLLNMDAYIATFVNSVSLPSAYMPAIIYAFSGIFAFLTGSSYGTFGLFIPLAVQLTQGANNCAQTLAIAAAISGSLIAAYSLTSDTLKLTAENTNGDIEYLRLNQLPYGLLLYITGIICFLLSGISIPYGNYYPFLIPLFTIFNSFILYFKLVPLLCDKANALVLRAFVHLKSHILYNMQTMHAPYPIHQHTFYSKYSVIEQIVILKVKRLLKTTSNTIPLTFPLKMPGL